MQLCSVRSPKLPPLVFEAQACAKDVLYVGVDGCAAGATGWTPPSPCPSCARRTALSPWTACCLLEPVAARGPGWYPKVSLGPHRVGHLRAEPRGRGDAAARAGARVDEVPHHAPLVGEGLGEVRAVQLAAAAHAVDHLRAGGSGAGRSKAGQRHAAEEPGAAAGHPAKPRSYLRQLPGAHPPQPRRLDLESCHLTLRHLYVGASRATQHGASRGSSMRWRTSKSTPHCLAISHTCRTSTSARPLRRATPRGAARGCRPGPRRGSAPSPSCTSRACPWRSP